MPEKTKGGQQAPTSETGTQLPGQGPALACYHFNLRHLRCKKSCPTAVREPGFSIRFVFWRSKSRCSLHLKPQDFRGPARPGQGEKSTCQPLSCFWSSLGAFSHSDSPSTSGDLSYESLFLQKYQPWEEGQMRTHVHSEVHCGPVHARKIIVGNWKYTPIYTSWYSLRELKEQMGEVALKWAHVTKYN